MTRGRIWPSEQLWCDGIRRMYCRVLMDWCDTLPHDVSAERAVAAKDSSSRSMWIDWCITVPHDASAE